MSNALNAVYASIDELVMFAQEKLELDPLDANITRNRIFALFNLDSYKSNLLDETQVKQNNKCESADKSDETQESNSVIKINSSIDDILRRFFEAAYNANLLDESQEEAYSDEIMGLLSANPSKIQQLFKNIESKDSSVAAQQWLYDYCVNNTYVKQSALNKNIRFNSHNLIITINLAKPEFKNMSKAASGNSVSGGYPKCTICRENEGFAGRNKRTLRTLSLTLGGKEWFWQFSPYGYFNQHGICVNAEHTPMVVNRNTFVNLLDFVDEFPHYFLGCNAALPRIGGSVLAHDHYQGGGEHMPMHHAQVLKTLHLSNQLSDYLSNRISNYENTIVEILDWPGTAIRVVSKSRESIIEVCDCIRKAWVDYDNPKLNIASKDEHQNQQSALSPSVIKTDRGYEMSLIFRNNAVSNEYPDGIFHAHPEYYAIKQEPIGLIEAQGLFILPGRLVRQLNEIAKALESGKTAQLPDNESEFGLVWKELRESLQGNTDKDAIKNAINEELGSICERILLNTAVFKDKQDLVAFLNSLGFIES